MDAPPSVCRNPSRLELRSEGSVICRLKPGRSLQNRGVKGVTGLLRYAAGERPSPVRKVRLKWA